MTTLSYNAMCIYIILYYFLLDDYLGMVQNFTVKHVGATSATFTWNVSTEYYLESQSNAMTPHITGF